MKSWRIAAGWLTAVVVVTVLTWQIVGLADSQVGPRPPVAIAAPSTTASSDALPTVSSTTTEASTSTSDQGSTTHTTSTSSPTTSSSAPRSTDVSSWDTRTINSLGGSVVIRHSPGQVELQAATPLPGFAVEVDDDGPDRVRVEFAGVDTDVRVEARWEDGSLTVDIDTD